MSLRTLTRLDLEDIRRVVREELRHALEPRAGDVGANNELGELAEEAVGRDVQELLKRLERETAERAARPIPNTPYVDRYDAARLLDVSYQTLREYTKRGLLTRRMVKGRIEVSRAEIDALLARRAKR